MCSWARGGLQLRTSRIRLDQDFRRRKRPWKTELAKQDWLGATEAGWPSETGDAFILKFSVQNNPSFPLSDGLPQISPPLPLRMRPWRRADVPDPFCTPSPAFAYLHPLQRGPLNSHSGGLLSQDFEIQFSVSSCNQVLCRPISSCEPHGPVAPRARAEMNLDPSLYLHIPSLLSSLFDPSSI